MGRIRSTAQGMISGVRDHGIIHRVATTSAVRALPRRWWLGAACAFAVLAAALLTYLVVTPVGEQSDEIAHLHYASMVAHHLALPGAGVQERQQPPLYYALVAAVLKLSGDSARAARLVSVVLTLLTAVALVVALRLLMPRRPWVVLAALWLFALLPSVQYEGAQVSNDPLAWLAGALVLLMLVVALRRDRLAPAHWAGVGAAAGLGIVAKATVWPLVILLLVAVLARHRRGLRAPGMAAALLPAVALCGWWFARNLVAFHRPLPPMTPITTSVEHTVRSAHQLASWVSLSWKSTVGVEGPLQTPLVVGPGRLGLYVLAATGIALAVVVAVATARAIRAWGQHRNRTAAWLLAAPALAVAFSLVNSVTLDDQPQARYLLVAATVWCGGTAWALSRLLRARPRAAAVLSAAALVGMLVLDAATVQTLRLAA